MDSSDPSNGYEAIAKIFIAGRGTGGLIGARQVRQWAETLPPGAAVLDLACGNGVPISQVLFDRGLAVHGLDASPTMIAAFRARFPHAPAECNTAEASNFFDRTFDAVCSWGLMFLLKPENQALVIRKVAAALKPGGRYLFTAAGQYAEWNDAMTGLPSVSLGPQRYAELLQAAGLTLVDQRTDEGDNYYYLSVKSDDGPLRETEDDGRKRTAPDFHT